VPRSRRAERRARRAYPGRSARRRVGWWIASAAGQRRRLAPRRPETDGRAQRVRRRSGASARRSSAAGWVGRRPVGLRGCWMRLSGALALLVLCVLAGGRLGLAGRRRRSLAGGAFVLALALAVEGGRGFPVAKRAGGEADRGRADLQLPQSLLRVAGDPDLDQLELARDHVQIEPKLNQVYGAGGPLPRAALLRPSWLVARAERDPRHGAEHLLLVVDWAALVRRHVRRIVRRDEEAVDVAV